MLRLSHAALIVVALALSGCCRDTMREMVSLKDTPLAPSERTSRSHPAKAAATAAEPSSRAARVDQDDDADQADQLETGSIAKPECQGEHLAYQATKEYLKNFGPKPADEPGERGPCTRGAQ